jgi:hypothetical protein
VSNLHGPAEFGRRARWVRSLLLDADIRYAMRPCFDLARHGLAAPDRCARQRLQAELGEARVQLDTLHTA